VRYSGSRRCLGIICNRVAEGTGRVVCKRIHENHQMPVELAMLLPVQHLQIQNPGNRLVLCMKLEVQVKGCL